MSDYFVVVVGHRYGSLADDSVSYTEWECDYAASIGIPVLAFIRKDVPGETQLVDHPEKLRLFKTKLKDRPVVEWSTRESLPNAVVTSVMNAVATSPGEGWVRGREYVNFLEAEGTKRFDWRQLWKSGYYATSFVYRLRLSEKTVTVAIHARVVPIRDGQPIKVVSFGFDHNDIKPPWDRADFSHDYWQLGESKVKKPGLKKPRTTRTTASREWMAYSYSCHFDEEPLVLSDNHIFTFHVDSLRFEATLEQKHDLVITRKGGGELATRCLAARDTGLVTWVADEPMGWAPGEGFLWEIQLDANDGSSPK